MKARANALRKLADHAGILPDFVDQSGRLRRTRDDTRVALLAAMRMDASSATAAARSLEERIASDDARLLPPVGLVQVGVRTTRLPLSSELGSSIEWAITLSTEDGATHDASGHARRRADGTFSLPLPDELAVGYHRLELTVRARAAERHGSQMLMVAPAACPSPAVLLNGQRVVGITANLYSVRSASNWGVGNFGDLAKLVTFAARNDAAFVGVNPLHALRNSEHDVSPYSPVSRLFRNPLYLDVEAIPELARTPVAIDRIASQEFQRELARLRGTRAVDYAAVTALQQPILELLHGTFLLDARAGAARHRHAAYADYVAAQGRALEDFATFQAIGEQLARGGSDSADWRRWPAEYRNPRSSAIAEFRATHSDRVDFYHWLQFEVDRQLGAVAGHARALELPIGVYQDLAIGSAPTGSDPWAFGDLFVSGACVGAPPDPLALEGQNWGLPPLDPRLLAEREFDYWIALVRSALQHAGALRIDHILGLFRQFWIPNAKTGREGAYVRFPAAEMLAILAIESTRSGAIVVGEDLGTVPPEVQPALERWGILSSRLLYFERDTDGEFRSSNTYPRMALTTATTHDLATIAGFWCGRDIDVRVSLGLTSDPAGRTERAARARERKALLRRLRADALLPPDDGTPIDDLAIRSATHAFLRRTPSWLVGLALDDLVGETEPVNVPGVGPDRFSSWTRRLSTPLEALCDDPSVARALGIERRWVPGAARATLPGKRDNEQSDQ